MSITLRIFNTFIALLLGIVIYGQAFNSPYSRFGIGDIERPTFMSSELMGDIGAAYTDESQINILNPASLGFLNVASFDIGLRARYTNLSERGGDDFKFWSGNLGYISLAIPLQNDINHLLDRKVKEWRFAMAFTLTPFSTVDYQVRDESVDPELGTVRTQFEGNGGSYQFLWSPSLRYKNLSIGANLGYVFGNIENTSLLVFDEVETAFANSFTNRYRFSGFTSSMGAMYKLVLNPKESKDATKQLNTLTLGVYGNVRRKFNGDGEVEHMALLFTANGSTIADTIALDNDITGEITLPSEIGFGAMYKKGTKLGLGVDLAFTQWDDYRNTIVNNDLNNTYNLSFGGYYRPNSTAVADYFSRVYYRFGFNLRNEPAETSVTGNLRTRVFSFGLGLPFYYQRRTSYANIGVSFGQRAIDTMLEENFWEFKFSFTFNDSEWFVKRKYN